MTIQSVAWAIEQQVPGNAGRVLIALANHSDHSTGHVDFDPPTIAREAAMQVASLWRYLGALERNGFLAKDERKPGDTDKREYWLILDRDPAVPWSWSAQDGSERADDAHAAEPTGPATARSYAPAGFSRDRQAEGRKAATALPPDRPPGHVPVIEGSKAFNAWCAHLRARKQLTPFVRAILVDDKWCRGFYMPTLFPPAEQIDDIEGAA